MGVQLADHAEFVGTYFVTPNFFATFGVAPAFVRGFESQGSRGHENAPRGAVVGLSFAQRNFSSGAPPLRQTLRMEGVAYQIVPVVPACFRFPPEAHA